MSETKNLIEDIQSNIDKLQQCENDYRTYVDTHIENVGKAWKEEVSKLDDEFIKENYNDISILIKDHDLSKYGDEEFQAYRANYYPVDDEEKTANEANFQSAWYHHFQNNPHHWQHWIDEEGELIPLENEDIVKRAYVEMICDWQAMGYVFGDTANQYYNQNKDTIKLYPELKKWVEDLLKKLDNKSDKKKTTKKKAIKDKSTKKSKKEENENEK